MKFTQDDLIRTERELRDPDAFKVQSKYTLEFEIEDLPKLYNSINRSHWAVKLKESRKWHNLVKLYSRGYLPTKPLAKVRLTLVRFSSKCPDPDGLCHSFKHVVDGLQRAEIIANDDYLHIGMPEYKWEKAPRGKGKIKVKVEEIE